MMTNIPTDLLRTFVSVVELRSFTRAAKAQGMTQPAVSAQIRRLQFLLGVELFDKSAPGVSLTPIGQNVIESAHRLLSVNDHIVRMASPGSAAELVRLGVRKDCMGEQLVEMLAATRARWPHLRLTVIGAGQRRMLQQLAQDQVDIVIALVPDKSGFEARHLWTEELTWVRGKNTVVDLEVPVPLLAYGDRCLCYSVAMATLERAGLRGELVFRANTAEALRSAVAANIGVMLLPRHRLPAGLQSWDDGPLPPAPAVYGGVFMREGAVNETLGQLADLFADILRPTSARPIPFASLHTDDTAEARRSA
jgi:DNA-binding transcriptional LysR family regulator